jgi:hypothetical protein
LEPRPTSPSWWASPSGRSTSRARAVVVLWDVPAAAALGDGRTVVRTLRRRSWAPRSSRLSTAPTIRRSPDSLEGQGRTRARDRRRQTAPCTRRMAADVQRVARSGGENDRHEPAIATATPTIGGVPQRRPCASLEAMRAFSGPNTPRITPTAHLLLDPYTQSHHARGRTRSSRACHLHRSRRSRLPLRGYVAVSRSR